METFEVAILELGVTELYLNRCLTSATASPS